MASRWQDNSKRLGRRQFLRLSGTAALAATTTATAVVGATGSASAAICWTNQQAGGSAEGRGPRCVVVGGGTSGLTLAKYLKKENPKFDVVMVEPNYLFMSPYLTNLWLDDIIDLSFVQHSFCDAARKGNYVWLQGKLIDLDRQNEARLHQRRLHRLPLTSRWRPASTTTTPLSASPIRCWP